MDISLVMPSFKQAPTIQKNLRELTDFLETLHISYEIILVVDGDVDGTEHIVRNTPELQHVLVETLPKNYGKGFALKHGFSKASGAIVGFIDAGGDIEYECIRLMIDLMKFSNADIVIGSKRHSLSRIEYPLLRRAYSMAYQLINQVLFRLSVRDTQVGVKLFRHEVIETILPHIHINRFAFDLEVLIIARAFHYNHIIESPVSIKRVFRSTINIFSVIETLRDTIHLYFRERTLTKVRPSPGISFSLLAPRTVKEEKHPEPAQ